MRGQAESEDPVLRYYCQRAAGQGESRDPAKTGLRYEVWVRTYLTHFGRGNKVELTDSALFRRFCSFGAIDSQQTEAVTKESLAKFDLSYPNVFQGAYEFRFFPNDTGGAALAIGFESDTVQNLSPVGLAVIDRTSFYLQRLYLYYPNAEKYERYSRTFSLRLQDGYVFPDTVVTMYSEAGIFAVEHYRIDTYVDSVRIFRDRPGE
ncbi:MAG TPA: hypothetical protein PLR32_01415 [candidate division Zixibacteria bacterium]|nr:hypothetical protein [candidate division Zixibacteria bacterium]